VSTFAGIRIRTDPGMEPGTFALVGICGWGDKANGSPPHSTLPDWRVTAACEHEHVAAIYLCGSCKGRAERFVSEGTMLCRQCHEAGDRAHDCPIGHLESVRLGDAEGS